MKPTLLLLILAIPTFTLAAAPSAKSTDKIIVAGRSIGDIHVGERLSKVEARYGESPDVDTTMGVVIEPWKVSGGTLEVQAHRPDEHIEIVTCVRTTSSRYHTANGLHVGSKLSEVRARYPHGDFSSAESVSFVGDKGGWLFGDPGIDFQFATQDHSSRCIAVRVWKPE